MPWLIGAAILAVGGAAVYVYEHHIKPGHKIPPPGVLDGPTAKEVNKAVQALTPQAKVIKGIGGRPTGH